MLPQRRAFSILASNFQSLQPRGITTFSTVKSTFSCSNNANLPTAKLPSPPMLWKPIGSARFQSTAAPSLSWTQYFAIRKEKRRYEQVGGILGALGAFGGASYYFSFVAPYDPTVLHFGMIDQIAVYLLATIGLTVVGWFGGSGCLSLIWRLRRSGIQKSMDVMDKTFFHHIAKNRALPSPNRPIPDYYGEKIFSLRDYKKWVKGQRDYVKKGEFKLFK